MKINVYVDGFNLYYGCLKNSPYRWLNLKQLCEAALPRDAVYRIRYFTARVKDRPGNVAQAERQQAYLRAISTLPNLSLHFGRYLESTVVAAVVNPPPPFIEVRKSEEKGSDVNIACQMLLDALDDDCDGLVLISNDSDLEQPVMLARKRFHKPVVILHPCRPPRRPSRNLVVAASKSLSIREQWLRDSQFPPTLADAVGTIRKPARW